MREVGFSLFPRRALLTKLRVQAVDRCGEAKRNHDRNQMYGVEADLTDKNDGFHNISYTRFGLEHI